MSVLLVIDDSKPIRDEVKKIFAMTSFFDVILEANNGIEGFKLLINNDVDIILCDVIMPSIDGFKFLTMMKAKPEYTDLPVIMLTGEQSPEKKIEGLNRGASDYVTKPFDAGELVARVQVQLKLKRLQDELKKSNALLKKLSSTDVLTKIHNRRNLMEMLDAEFERANRYGNYLSLLMVDIDHFKNVNDTYGHQMGDEVLSGLGDILRETKRKNDMPGRYGGEEFIVILPHSDPGGSLIVAERLREHVEQKEFKDSVSDPLPLKITISIGVATFPAPNIKSAAELIKRADEALYEAKETGRNKVVVAESSCVLPT